ncbi:MAG: NAD(P)-binding domain-containing protein [Pelagimonas sp.]|jgi:pyrroline-5-carboxylate reductase|nr:NAD(P)-binding domain-containing protein [Pelagimonas sp.]
MKIGILGTGIIATKVVHGIAQDGHQITVSERSAQNAKALAEAYEAVTIADNQGVLDASDVVFLGLMAEDARKILPTLQFRDDQKVITLMAEATLDEVDELVRPAQARAIMMPFPAIAKGGSPIMMQGDADLVRSIFGNRNSVYVLQNSEEMAAYLCAQAVLSSVARMMADAAEWLAPQVSDPAQGEAFLHDLIASSLKATPSSHELIKALNTPGGYNQRLRQHMEGSGISSALRKGLDDLKG